MANASPIFAPQSKNPLSCFIESPRDISFETQEKNEKIILMLRAHIITLVPAVVQVALMIVLPFFIAPLLSLLNLNILQTLSRGQVFWLWVFWGLLTFGVAFYRFIFWYFNVYFLTNERIVDFDFRGILDKQIAFTTLAHIEDVTPKTIGFFGTFFNFGDVYIQTAAEKPEFEFEKVPKPDLVAQRILEQVRQEEEEGGGEIA